MTAAVPAAPQPPPAGDLNAGRPAMWSGAVAPGGMVCAMPDDLTADGICGNPVESEPCGRHDDDKPPARPLTAPDVVAGLLADVAGSRAQLADAAPELVAAMAETRQVRDGYQQLCREFGPSAQSGWSARVSLTVLNRHRVNAGLIAFARAESDQREDITMRYRRERDEAREVAAEMLAHITSGDDYADPATLAGWRKRAGLEANGGING